MCPKWQTGQCVQVNCPKRHMIIEKARNQIQCYWENKPSGCRKPHCVFRHSKRSTGRNSSNASANAAVVNAGVNHSVMATAGSIETK